MRNHQLVRPEHLNHFGFLFGGCMLQWVDEVSWMSATTDYPGCHFVTIAMDKVEFRRSVKDGTILTFETEKTHVGRTSVQYRVRVFGKVLDTREDQEVFSTAVTLVRVDDGGHKLALPETGTVT